MRKYELDDLIEEKRAQMQMIEKDRDIRQIHQEIRRIADTMTLEPMVREVDCRTLLKTGDFDFAALLYRLILLREPSQEEYIGLMETLLSGQSNRIELIEAFANSEEGKKKDVRIKGLERQKTKYRIARILKRIPGIGYICRLVTNLVFLSRRMDLLHRSYNSLLLRNEILNQQYEELYSENSELLRKYKNIQDNGYIDEDKARENKKILDTFYLHYNEKLMPDSREDVKGRAMIYIDKLKKWYQDTRQEGDDLNMVDLGCGECEWVELLNANGFTAIGVDDNEAVVEKVKREFPGYAIIQDDAIQYLKKCDSSSIDCISSFHMVEHMDFMTIITLLRECYRVLKKDGMLIIETPNPQNILTSTYYFHLDPTHNKPIPPELLQFFIEESGFEVYEKLLLNPLNFEPYEYRDEDPIKDIIFRFNMEQAYSIMAVKR